MKATQDRTSFAGDAPPPGMVECGTCHGSRYLPHGPIDDEDRGQLCPACYGDGVVPKFIHGTTVLALGVSA